MSQKPSIPKGTRDFGPLEMQRRNYIFAVIRRHFERYGFKPIETPAMENLSTLLGKYGDEGDKLLFRILDSGDFLSSAPEAVIGKTQSREMLPYIAEKGLRYDLTVPFARFVVQHRNDFVFPFRRYQIQNVWRADRPQKGRYREFYQCDADIIGSDSLLNEAELLKLIDDVFAELNIAVTIRLNNRKLLAGIAEVSGLSEQLTDITVAIDKLDKIGLKGVLDELRQKNISEEALEKLMPLFEVRGGHREKLDFLNGYLSESQIGRKGLEEMEETLNLIALLKPSCTVETDLTLARGLNYYTGAIIEVGTSEIQIGSICGGGRYDNLTGVFGMEGVSGVGISFGADRIYDVMNEAGKFPEHLTASTLAMIVRFGEAELRRSLEILGMLRAAGIPSEIYPDEVKMKKQFAYADANRIPFVLIAGEEEIKNGQVTLKNMQSGTQSLMTPQEAVQFISSAN